ncbi:MAG: hypothetical protein PWQ82_1016 [Thermosediminibacterales bacterium]|nr:hypothetical protein [Thermosediminibacterales bacterium]MDK2836202.1 hypothetical protein [Thermosediminibacterales bacterium]
MRRILVVEDSGLTRLQLREMLKKAGYEVFEAVRGQQVIVDSFHQKYSLKDMDLIILDFYLEDVDGTEVLKKLAEKYPNLPVIIMSGEKKRETIIKCLDLGAKDYILKPYNERILISRIERILSEENSEDIKKSSAGHKKKDLSEKIDELLVNEIDRAIRGKTNLAVVRYLFDVDETEMEKMYQASLKKLRSIDLAFKSGNSLILILPFTDPEGERVVHKKLIDLWRKEKYIEEEPKEIKVFFPDDVEEKELIKNYKKVKIKDLLLSRINKLLNNHPV